MLNVKQFVPPNNQREWAYWRQLKEMGKAIGVPSRENTFEPENARQVRVIFQGDSYMAREIDNIETLVSFLNDEVEVEGSPFNVPMNRAEEYLLLFNDHVLAYIFGDDEYMGQGSSETYMQLKGISVNGRDIPLDSELLEIAQWLQRAFSS